MSWQNSLAISILILFVILPGLVLLMEIFAIPRMSSDIAGIIARFGVSGQKEIQNRLALTVLIPLTAHIFSLLLLLCNRCIG
jgi:hypothetical protein